VSLIILISFSVLLLLVLGYRNRQLIFEYLSLYDLTDYVMLCICYLYPIWDKFFITEYSIYHNVSSFELVLKNLIIPAIVLSSLLIIIRLAFWSLFLAIFKHEDYWFFPLLILLLVIGPLLNIYRSDIASDLQILQESFLSFLQLNKQSPTTGLGQRVLISSGVLLLYVIFHFTTHLKRVLAFKELQRIQAKEKS